MAKRLDLLPQPVVEEEAAAAMEAEEEAMCDLVTQRTQKALERFVTERLAGHVTTDTTAARCWATAVPQKRQAGPPPSLSLRALRSDEVKEEMAKPPVKRVGREDFQAPDAAAAAGEEGNDGREADSASFPDGCSIRVVSVLTLDAGSLLQGNA